MSSTGSRIPRRSAIGLGSLLLAGCRRDDEGYFGDTRPPSLQRLVFENHAEPETVDPAKTQGGSELSFLTSLFEGLVSPHPVTLEPLAGMATHYEASPDFKRFTFYLRGHSKPCGNRLGDVSRVLPGRVSSRMVPSDRMPAQWSDGAIITARDFVYSWRRILAPETAAGFGVSYFYYIEGAREINLGKAAPETLGVAALDDFTLEIHLHKPTPFLLSLLWVPWFCPVPAHRVESARQARSENLWTAPGNIIVNGPFTLAQWRPNDRVLLRKNHRYYGSASVLLDQVFVLPTRDEQTFVSLYKSGYSHSMQGHLLSPQTLPALRHKRDLLRAPAAHTVFYSINSSQPPFDNLLVRYALNMSIDKKIIANYLSGSQQPAAGFVPPMRAFSRLANLPVLVGDRSYDVLSFGPAAARDLLARAGYPGGFDNKGTRLSFRLTTTQRPRAGKTAEILQQQWRDNLGIDVRLANLTESLWAETLTAKRYDGMIEDAWAADYLDPNAFLSLFITPGITGVTWSDPLFEAHLEAVNATAESASRMKELADCERYMMRFMPVVPLYFDSWSYLQKPFVRGLWMNPRSQPFFKYAWIDTNWRPQ
jgi:oligopeptide transport system substrate-binding protein